MIDEETLPGSEQPDSGTVTETTEAVETPIADAVEADSAGSTEGGEDGSGQVAGAGDAAEPADDAEAAARPRKKQTRDERIDQIIAQRNQARSRIRALERRLAQSEAAPTPPAPDDYEDWDDYQADRAAHSVVRAHNETQRAERQAELEEALVEDQQAMAQAWVMRVEDFKKNVPDFEQVAYGIQHSQTATQLIAEMESGPAVAYYLGKNPAEAFRISQLPERAAAMALGGIEARLNAKPPRRVSKAPEPVQTLSGRSGGNSPDLSKMSFAEYERHVNAQEFGDG